MSNPIVRVQLDHVGLEKFLGPLESTVMLALWALKRATLSELHRYVIAEAAPLAYSTISTTVTRLYTRGLVHKYPVLNEAPIYAPAYASEAAFLTACLRSVCAALVEDFDAEQVHRAITKAAQRKEAGNSHG